MTTQAHLEVFLADAWYPAAIIRLGAPAARGWEGATTLGYELGYAIHHEARRDAAALSVNAPVSVESTSFSTWPAFLIDLLPQGYGRQELLRQLGLPATAAESADWKLLLAGAGNPIGNVRVREAADHLLEHAAHDHLGFTRDEIIQRGEAFTEYLASHGLFVAGSSGVQGEWPKILLAEGHDGLYYLDHALPDDEVAKHWLVKFGRGPNAALATILRLEASYMELARYLGLNVHGRLEGGPRTVFIPRFDREVSDGRVHRYAQESLASFCGIPGFGVAPSHNEACRKLAAICTDPVRDLVEYLRRDVANIALGNKDNHARNTAIQRRENGFIGLTPLFDFVPMMLHPDGIARRMRWQRDDGGSPRWASVIEQIAEATNLPAEIFGAALREMLPQLRGLREYALKLGVDEEVMDMQRMAIEGITAQVEAL
jgi:serine/threonine-protein kinase HipA